MTRPRGFAARPFLLMSILSVANLRKTYGDTVAVDGVSFSVAPREVLGLLGPNGAGKTTTINMILGVLEPTAGSITIDGRSLASDRRAALSRTNFAAVYAPLPGNLTVEQNLRIFGMLYGVRQLGLRIDAVIRQFDLERFRRVKCGVLSSGEQTRFSVAKAMLNRNSVAVFPAAKLPGGVSTLRVAMSVNQAGAGYLAGFSRTIVHRRS